MYDDRQVEPACQLKLAGHEVNLRLSRIWGVVVVEADLAHRGNAGVVQLDGFARNLVAVPADRLVDLDAFDTRGRRQRYAIVEAFAAADCHYPRHAGCCGTT